MNPGDRTKLRIALVDAVNVLRRAYEAMPGDSDVARSAADTALRSIQRTLRTLHPTHAVVVFDGGGRGWRHAIYAQYKANRPPTPAPVREAIDVLELAASELDLATARLPGVEADDVIASITASLAPRGVGVVIVSTDRGFAQLISEQVGLYDYAGNSFRDASWVEQHFGVAPGQVAELLALAGNPTDNLPGVTGIGPKTAARLLHEYGSLQAIMAAATTIGGRTGQRLQEQAESVQLWLRLARLRTDVSLGLTLSDARLPAGTAGGNEMDRDGE
jgi:5'-3' exonuclease